MRKPTLLVSAHSPGPLLWWTQLAGDHGAPDRPRTCPPRCSRSPGCVASQSSVLLPVISLWSRVTLRDAPGPEGAEAVLAVVGQAVGADDVVGAHEQPRPPRWPGWCCTPPSSPARVVVDHALVHGGPRSRGSVRWRITHPGGLAGEGVAVDAPAVEDRPRRADVDVAVLGDHLGELVVAQDVDAGRQPERGPGGAAEGDLVEVGAGVDAHRSGRRRRGPVQQGGVAADLGGRAGRVAGGLGGDCRAGGGHDGRAGGRERDGGDHGQDAGQAPGGATATGVGACFAKRSGDHGTPLGNGSLTAGAVVLGQAGAWRTLHPAGGPDGGWFCASLIGSLGPCLARRCRAIDRPPVESSRSSCSSRSSRFGRPVGAAGRGGRSGPGLPGHLVAEVEVDGVPDRRPQRALPPTVACRSASPASRSRSGRTSGSARAPRPPAVA